MVSCPAAHPYAAFLHAVSRPARYVGGETGQVRKDWAGATGRMCLAFPDAYEVGMSHLGTRILYSVLNSEPDLLAERCFAPWTDMEAALRERGEPLRSLENARALADFDVVGFSLQYELTFTNVLAMLELGGVPLRACDRAETDPLVIFGGPVATHAEPMAPFADAMLIGDGEAQTPRIVRTWSELARSGTPRAERLRQLAALEGVYVPSLYETETETHAGLSVVTRGLAPEAKLPIARAHVPDLEAFPFPHDGPVATTETVFDRVSVEIARGCTEGCRFCQAGMIYRPVRERKPLSILRTVERAVLEGGYDEASLTCLSTADYSAIAPLVRATRERLDGERVALGVSSLRAYGLSEQVLDDLRKTRATGLTFAPEAGSQRMRDVVNKNVTDAQLMETARRVFSRGWKKMKLYFMIGLPTEDDDDVAAIVETGVRAFKIGKGLQGGRGPRVTVSVSTFVPKPHTPFQWCAMDSLAEVQRKQALLAGLADRERVQLRLHESDGSVLEAVIARGDRRLADVIEGAFRLGARFDSWQEQLRPELWQQAFADAGVDANDYLGTWPTDMRLPWDHIDVGLAEGFLLKEYKKALKNRLSPPCGKPVGLDVHHPDVTSAEGDGRKLVCYHCGVECDLRDMREARIDKLVSLGAQAPVAASSPAAPAEHEHGAVARNPKPAPSLPHSRVRIRYECLGAAPFSSHLDRVRLLPRILRRAGLSPRYSQGFHPKPVMTFAPSLPVGVASLCEHVDVHLEGPDANAEDVLTRLNAATVPGIRFTEARVLGATDANIAKVIDRVQYVAAFSDDALRALGVTDAKGLGALFEERRGRHMVVTRTIKGRSKAVDVGAFLVSVSVNEGAEALSRAGVDARVPVRITLALTDRGTARAAEVVEALTGDAGLPVRFVRAAMTGDRAGDRVAPLALEQLRRAMTDTEPVNLGAPGPTHARSVSRAEPRTPGEPG